MSLREKAKTLVEIIKKSCSYVYLTRCKDCVAQCEFEGTEHFAGKWVRLEDAEQAIAELKQKLQQFKCSLEIQLDVLKSKPHHSETETQLEIMLNEFKEKFEELLKEVKQNEVP